MSITGRIVDWQDERGFGFVEPLNGQERAFVHISAFSNRSQRPVAGELVAYEQQRDGKGRLQAKNIEIIGRRPGPSVSGKLSLLSGILLWAFGAFLITAVLLGYLHKFVLAIYALTSIITYVLYALDKSAAQTGSWRWPESTLHFMAIAGGWPGALFAQQRIRHKSSKKSFRSVFWFTVFLNCVALGWLFTDSARQLFNSLLA